MQIVGLCGSIQSGYGGERIAFVNDRRDDAAVTEKMRIQPGSWLFRMAVKAVPEQRY